MNEKISVGNKYLYTTMGSEWMACQYSGISEDTKFLAGKSSIPLKYHFDTSTVFSASWNAFTLRVMKICGMILKQKMSLNIKSQFVSVFFNSLKAFSRTD